MQAVVLTFKLLLVSVIFSVLLLWGVWQVISILGSGTYPPLTCADSNVKTTLACAQLVKKKKKKMPWLRLYPACLFFYIFIAQNKIYLTVFTEVMPFIKLRSTLAKTQSQTTRACKLLLSRSLHEECEHFQLQWFITSNFALACVEWRWERLAVLTAPVSQATWTHLSWTWELFFCQKCLFYSPEEPLTCSSHGG